MPRSKSAAPRSAAADTANPSAAGDHCERLKLSSAFAYSDPSPLNLFSQESSAVTGRFCCFEESLCGPSLLMCPSS